MKNANDSWCRVANFIFPSEVQILKSFLESQDIDCCLQDEYAADILPGLPNIGVKLLVRENDLEVAISLIKEGGFEEYLDVY